MSPSDLHFAYEKGKAPAGRNFEPIAIRIMAFRDYRRWTTADTIHRTPLSFDSLFVIRNAMNRTSEHPAQVIIYQYML